MLVLPTWRSRLLPAELSFAFNGANTAYPLLALHQSIILRKPEFVCLVLIVCWLRADGDEALHRQKIVG